MFVASHTTIPASRAKVGAAWTLPLTLSGAAHATMIAFVLTRPLSETGINLQPTEAVSIEITTTTTLEAIDSAAQAEGAQSAEPPIDEVIETKPDEVKAMLAADEPPVEEPQNEAVAEAQAADVVTPELETITGQDVSNPVPPQAHKPAPQKKIKTAAAHPQGKPEENAVRQPASKRPAAPKGADASVGSKAKVSASRGDVAGYAAKVRARVASRRPAGNGARGTVVVSFAVSGSGGLLGARIASSSGDSRLDSAALRAVSGAGPFPPTPSGARISFSVPFHYR